MDDASLQSLSIKAVKLQPKFNTNVTEYSVDIPSNVESIAFSGLTTDSGASWTLKDGGGERSVSIKEGDTKVVVIEVTAEDGKTVKYYRVTCHRLSDKEAKLKTVTFEKVSIVFDANQRDYDVEDIAWTLQETKAAAEASQEKCAILINQKESKSETIKLKYGVTVVTITVTSVDGSTRSEYTFRLSKRQPPFSPVTPGRIDLYCPLSLGLLHLPFHIDYGVKKGTHASFHFLNGICFFDRTNPFTGSTISLNSHVIDDKIEQEIENAKCVVFENEIAVETFGKNENLKIDLKDEFKAEELGHKIELTTWEKQLRQIFNETEPAKLLKQSDSHVAAYLKGDDNPMDKLNQAIYCVATALEHDSKPAATHATLSFLLEEKYYAEEAFGLKQQDSMLAIAGRNMEAVNEAKEDEVRGICKLHGFDGGSLSEQLRALDMEYHHLVSAGKPAEAVQNLFEWKSKQLTESSGGKAKALVSSASLLGQATIKMLDACSKEETKSQHQWHVGRLLLQNGEIKGAKVRLEASLSWNKNQALCYLYYGFCLATLKSDINEAFKYMKIGATHFLNKLKDEKSGSDLIANTSTSPIVALNNRALLKLGELYLRNGSGDIAEYYIRTAAQLSSNAIVRLKKGEVRTQHKLILLDCHEVLLSKTNVTQLQCLSTLSLVHKFKVPNSRKIHSLQRKCSEILVEKEQTNSLFLYNLGKVQIDAYELTGLESHLSDAIKSFEAAIDNEGKSTTNELPAAIKEQTWVKEAEQRKAKTLKPCQQAAASSGAAKPNTASKTPAAAISKSAGVVAKSTKPAAAAKAPPPKPAPSKVPPAAPATKGKTATSKSGAVQQKTTAVVEEKVDAPPQGAAGKEAASEKQSETAAVTSEINVKSHLPRLELARIFAQQGAIDKSKAMYEAVLSMREDNHDARIELADMLVKSDKMAAVQVYCQFPVSEDPSFDDAYIFNEIIRLLMAEKQFKDERLKKYMILYGKVMGLAQMENWVTELEAKLQTDLLKEVYAAVNNKSVDDEQMVQFFKFKCWT